MNKILLTSFLAMSLSATPALADHFTLPSGSGTEKVVALSTIDLKNATNGNNNMPIQLNKSVRGGTLSIAGATFDSGWVFTLRAKSWCDSTRAYADLRPLSV